MADWWSKVRSGAGQLRQRVQERQTELRASAEKWVALFDQARHHADDPTRIIHPLAATLESLRRQLDREAQAIVVALVRESGVGRADVDGSRITYVRPEGPARGQIRVSDVYGTAAALAAGVAASGFAACLYGERTSLMEPLRWRGADAGVLVTSIGFFRADFEPAREHLDTPVGWSVGIELGVGLGVPILSEIGTFDLHERVVGSSLVAREASPLEDVLRNAPDRRLLRLAAQRWVRPRKTDR